MELKFQKYIYQLLNKAHYEYDASVKAWAGWIKNMPGVYAQGKNIEEARSELMSALEDRLFIDLKKGKALPGFSTTSRQHAKTR